MIKLILIFSVALAPSLCSLWLIRRLEARARQRLQQALARTTTASLETVWRSPTDLDPLTHAIGDVSCRYNARSPYLRCAVNPAGPCKTCRSYQPLTEGSTLTASIREEGF